MSNNQNPLSGSSPLTNLSQLPPLASSHGNSDPPAQVDSEHSAMSLTPPADPSAPPLGHAFQPNLPQHTSLLRHETPPHRYQPARMAYRPPPMRDSRESHLHQNRQHSPPRRRYEYGSRSSSREHSSPEHYLTRSLHPRNSRSHRHNTYHDRNRAPLIKRETLAGLPPWPTNLKLSLSTGNWLEWSRSLLRSLTMTQLDEYPLGLLRCPDERTDLLWNHCWHGNDRMILGFMQTHMYSAEIQHIAACTTSAEAFRMLRVRHEKRSGLTQLQLIQRLMQITFDDDPEQFDANMATFRDLVYRIESIGQVDISKLGLLFILLNLKSSHPTVHDALAPALMDGSITVELMEHRMRYHFEMRGAQQGQQHLPGQQNLPGPSIALPALPQRTFMCPNCKRPGHTIEFCIAPGGKMEGLSMHDAINRQRIARESFRQRARPREEGSTSTSSAPLKLDDDGSIWIAGVRYRPENKISAAMANSEVQTPNPDLEEYSEWPGDGYTDTFLDTNAILIASIDSPDVTDVALFSHPADPPFFLDSGESSHISCIRSDFTSMKSLNEPRKISGVGNASVSAVGVGTVILLLPQTNAQLRLHNVLFAPEACVRLISIHQLNN